MSAAFAGPATSPIPSATNAQKVVFLIALPPFPLAATTLDGVASQSAAGDRPADSCGLELVQEAFHCMALCDMEPGVGDPLAAAARAAAGGVEVAGGALAEDEAAGDAARGVDLQPPVAAL